MYDNGLVCSVGEGDPQNITNINGSFLLHGIVLVETIEMKITEYIDPKEMRESSAGILTNTDLEDSGLMLQISNATKVEESASGFLDVLPNGPRC